MGRSRAGGALHRMLAAHAGPPSAHEVTMQLLLTVLNPRPREAVAAFEIVRGPESRTMTFRSTWLPLDNSLNLSSCGMPGKSCPFTCSILSFTLCGTHGRNGFELI